VPGWSDACKAVRVLTAVAREPRVEVPRSVLRDALRAVDTSVFWEVQSAFLQLLTYFSFVRTETPLAKTYAGGKQPHDPSQHWVVGDLKFATDPELHFTMRLKDIKQSTEAERTGSSEDLVILGLIPESYDGGVWSLAYWYKLLMSFYPQGRPDKSAPFFLDRDQNRWYIYSNALSDARRLWMRGTEGVEWNDYGLHGLRVLGYNDAEQGVGEKLTACHGRWSLPGKSWGPAHRQYLRYLFHQIVMIPFAMLGLVESAVVEEPAESQAPTRTAARRFFELQPLSRSRDLTRHTVGAVLSDRAGNVQVDEGPTAEGASPEKPREGFYVIDHIVEERKYGRGMQYLIRWEGYGSDEDTWEPAGGIKDPEILADFAARKAQAAEGAPPGVPPLGVMLDDLSVAPPSPCVPSLESRLSSTHTPRLASPSPRGDGVATRRRRRGATSM